VAVFTTYRHRRPLSRREDDLTVTVDRGCGTREYRNSNSPPSGAGNSRSLSGGVCAARGTFTWCCWKCCGCACRDPGPGDGHADDDDGVIWLEHFRGAWWHDSALAWQVPSRASPLMIKNGASRTSFGKASVTYFKSHRGRATTVLPILGRIQLASTS
jgi:hypothetical protein